MRCARFVNAFCSCHCASALRAVRIFNALRALPNVRCVSRVALHSVPRASIDLHDEFNLKSFVRFFAHNAFC